MQYKIVMRLPVVVSAVNISKLPSSFKGADLFPLARFVEKQVQTTWITQQLCQCQISPKKSYCRAAMDRHLLRLSLLLELQTLFPLVSCCY